MSQLLVDLCAIESDLATARRRAEGDTPGSPGADCVRRGLALRPGPVERDHAGSASNFSTGRRGPAAGGIIRVVPRQRPLVDPEWDLERVTIDLVILGLEREDRVIADLWYPDHDRDPIRSAGRGTPDAAMLVDGAQAAIEVAHAWPHPRGVAAHRATSTSLLVRDRLRAARPRMNLYVGGEFDLELIMRRPPGLDDQEAERIADAVMAVADEGIGFMMPVGAADLPAWLVSLYVTRWDRESSDDPALFRPSQSVVLLARSDRSGHVADVLRFLLNVKAPQVARWGLGIVVLIEGASDLGDDVAAEMATLAHPPLWRLYWLGGGHVRMIWSRDAT